MTILPLAGKIIDAVQAALAAWWPELTLAIDLDKIPALASDRQALWAQVADADFLSDDEKRQMLGFAPRSGDVGEVTA
jgi:phage portal protein BeeE